MVVYLGITLDRKLIRNVQVDRQVKNATVFFLGLQQDIQLYLGSDAVDSQVVIR